MDTMWILNNGWMDGEREIERVESIGGNTT